MSEICPVCGSTDHHVYYGFVDLNKDFILCHVCQCAFLKNRMTDEEALAWYRDGSYRERTLKHAPVELELRHQEMRAINIASYVTGTDIKSHLDIGCSAGALLKEVKKQHPGTWSIGVDVDPVYTQYAEGLKIVPSIDYALGPFDLITLIHTLEHISNPVPFMEKIASKLSPGGILIVEVPNRRAYLCAYSAPEHLIAYEPHSLKFLLNKVGLNVGLIELQGHIQASPLDLNVLMLASNDLYKMRDRYPKEEEQIIPVSLEGKHVILKVR